MLGTMRKIFDVRQISANIQNEDFACPKKVVQRANILAYVILGNILREMSRRLTRAKCKGITFLSDSWS